MGSGVRIVSETASAVANPVESIYGISQLFTKDGWAGFKQMLSQQATKEGLVEDPLFYPSMILGFVSGGAGLAGGVAKATAVAGRVAGVTGKLGKLSTFGGKLLNVAQTLDTVSSL